jgi:hypothetical protein
MKTKPRIARENWVLDGRHHHRLHPDDLETPRRSQGDRCARRQRRLGAGEAPDETLIRALARAHRWKLMLEERRYRSAGELAEAEGLTRSFVTRLLRLSLLAPDIVEAILNGQQPKGMQLEELTRAMPSEWKEQRAQRNSHRPTFSIITCEHLNVWSGSVCVTSTKVLWHRSLLAA